MTQNSKTSRRLLPFAAGLFSLAAMIVLGSYWFWHCPQPIPERIVIFIHGTIHPELGLLNPVDTLSDSVNTVSHTYRQRIAKIRDNPLTYEDQTIQDYGLKPIEQLTDQELAEHTRGIAFIIPAYDAVAHLADATAPKNRYYTFGWLGLMSNGSRKEEGFKLYDALCDERAKFAVPPHITIVTHSHGGNVALWLAQAEKERKRGLHIDSLILWGTPVHRSTAYHARADIFGRVVSFYSDGDWIQGTDVFSTPERACKKRFGDWYATDTDQPAPQQVHDIRLMANGSKHLVDHRNMWFMGNSNTIFDWLWPLPLVILTPLLAQTTLQTLELPGQAELHIGTDGATLTLTLRPENEEASLHTVSYGKEFFDLMQELAETTRQDWHPTHQNSGSLLSAKNGKVLWQALFG